MKNAYLLEPCDPIVLGDGRPIDRSAVRVWPVPASLAAAINGWLGKGQPGATLRGPLLRFGTRLFAPPPADAMRHPGQAQAGAWMGGKLVQARGLLWPSGFPKLDRVLVLPEQIDVDSSGASATPLKLEKLEDPLPLDTLLDWALSQSPPGPDLDPRAPRPEDPAGDRRVPRLWRPERRTQVAIAPDTLTADPGLLFTTPGARLERGVAFALDWSGPPLPEGLVPFGGEGRLGRLSLASEALFPGWASKSACYQERCPDHAFLRVQLLTPGLFDHRQPVPIVPAWLLPEDPDQPCERFTGHLFGDSSAPFLSLIGYRANRFLAFSGWKTTKKGDQEPRPVRRLVPAGAVLWFGDAEGRALPRELLLAAAEALWLQGLDGPHSPATPLGFALSLPGFTPSGD